MFKSQIGLALVAVSASLAFGRGEPVRVTGEHLSHATLRAVSVGERVHVERFAAPNQRLDLELERVRLLTDDARVVIASADGERRFDASQVVLLSGSVAGEPDSRAFIALSPYGTNGFIDHSGELISISSGPYAQGKDLDAALHAALMRDAIDPDAAQAPACGYTAGDKALEPAGPPMINPQAAPSRGTTSCRIASIALETDWEFTDRLFAGNPSAAAAYALSLLGAISEIYERDINVRLAVPYLRVWADNSDPYSLGGDPLDQVRAYWNTFMGDIDRTVTHYLTGRQDMDYGGVAYLGVLCFNEYGYGVSGYLDGSFPYPLIDYSYGNWDVFVAAHELGHNFGTPHTHDFNPQVDGCGTGDCSGAFGGTIMSYCHICPGGLNNIRIGFHAVPVQVMLNFLDSADCNLDTEGVVAANDLAFALEDQALEIDALGNDVAQSCDSFTFEGAQSVTDAGGAVEVLHGQGPGGRALFRYTPPAGYAGADSFNYSISGDAGTETARVDIDVRAMRDADYRADPIPGLRLKYYELTNPTSLPDFSQLDPIAEEASASIFYPSSSGMFINSGLFDNVGAVFSGYVWAQSDGDYLFSTESDDGSRIYIGDQLVVDNDGIHGMIKRTGSIPLRAGWHSIRIEFFDAEEGAGLIARMAAPGTSEQTLEASLLSHETTERCSPADLNADGAINFFDVSSFLSLFNAGDIAADLTGDDDLNFFDISAFLQAFNAGCP